MEKTTKFNTNIPIKIYGNENINEEKEKISNPVCNIPNNIPLISIHNILFLIIFFNTLVNIIPSVKGVYINNTNIVYKSIGFILGNIKVSVFILLHPNNLSIKKLKSVTMKNILINIAKQNNKFFLMFLLNFLNSFFNSSFVKNNIKVSVKIALTI